MADPIYTSGNREPVDGLGMMRWFGRGRAAEPARVYLGTLAVVPPPRLDRHLDAALGFARHDHHDLLREDLESIFTLPSSASIETPRKDDLVLDIIVPGFRCGGWLDLQGGMIWLPLFWRPTITVTAHLYEMQSRRTKAAFTVTERMPFTTFFGLGFRRATQWDFKSLWRSYHADTREDMRILLEAACLRLMTRINRAI